MSHIHKRKTNLNIDKIRKTTEEFTLMEELKEKPNK